MAAYLHDTIDGDDGMAGNDRFTKPPLIWPGESLTAGEWNALVRGVQIVNTALPGNWKLQIPSESPALPAVMQERGPYITVEFLSQAEWRAKGLPG